MYIDESVTEYVSSVEDTYGFCFDSTVTGSITINGNFFVACYGSHNSSCVYFDSTGTDSTLNIGGNFTTVSDSLSGVCWGVYFEDMDAGSTTIDGNFLISNTGESCGVSFQDSLAGSTQNINGNFSISGRGSDGVYFGSAAVGSVQNITGNFSIFGGNNGAQGIDFGSDARGALTINGNFSIGATSGDIEGLSFEEDAPADSTQNISGNFAIYTGTGDVYGILFNSATPPAGTRTGTPTFYSNKSDSGN
jgi:hypothetical protein